MEYCFLIHIREIIHHLQKYPKIEQTSQSSFFLFDDKIDCISRHENHKDIEKQFTSLSIEESK